jgi:hypothetical protein
MPFRESITVSSAFHLQNYHHAARKRRRHFLITRSLRFPILGAACAFVLSTTVFLAHGPKALTQKGDFSREILEEDRRFLDVLFEKTNSDGRTGRESFPVPMQKIDNTSNLESGPKTVRRAMLVVNTEIVRRGQPVVHNEAARRKRQNITPWRRHVEVL